MLNPKTGKKWKIYLGIPTTGTVADFQGYMLRELEDRYGDEVELVYPKVLCQRIFHDFARNETVREFLDTDCDILWFLDSDVVPPAHVLDLVTSHGDTWKCAAAPYPVFMSQPNESFRQLVFTIYSNHEGKLVPAHCPDNGTEFLAGAATGCLFIKREVLEEMEQPYFEFKFDPKTRQPIEGEDLGFCHKMISKGIPFFVDYSMVCKHYKNNIDLLEINNYALTFAQKHVNAYQENVNAQLKIIDERYRALVAENKALKEQVSKGKSSGLVNSSGHLIIK